MRAGEGVDVKAPAARPAGRWSQQVGRFVAFTRPFTLLPPTLGVVSGAVCAWGSAWNPDPARRLTLAVALTVVLGSICAALLNAASNVINQIYDLPIDRVNKPGRMLPSGLISRRAAWVFSVALYVVAVAPTWLVVIHPAQTLRERLLAPEAAQRAVAGFAGWTGLILVWHACFFIYVAGMLFTFIYSAPTLGRTKRLPIGANLTIATPRGLLLKVAGWSMVGPVVALEPWWIGLVFGLFLLGASSTKDFSDMEGDRVGGCRTLPIRYGVLRAAQLMAPFFIAPWALIPLGVALPDPFHTPRRPILTGNPWALCALALVLAGWGGYTVWLILRDPEALAATENHPSWTHMYLMMMTAQLGFAAAYLL